MVIVFKLAFLCAEEGDNGCVRCVLFYLHVVHFGQSGLGGDALLEIGHRWHRIATAGHDRASV